MRQFPFILLFILIILASPSAEAQPSQLGEKKLVRRTIYLTEDTAKADSSFSQMLINDVRSGKLTAYHYSETGTTKKLPLSVFSSPEGIHISDSVYFVNPTTGKEFAKARPKPDYYFPKLSVTEELIFNTTTKQTERHIVSIGPVKDIYGKDWKEDDDLADYRGNILLFWVKYSEAQKTIARYDKRHPLKTIAQQIKEDYPHFNGTSTK